MQINFQSFFTKVFANTNNPLIFVLPNAMMRAGKQKKVMSGETIKIYNETEKTLTIEQQSSVNAAARNAGFKEANVIMIETDAVPGTMIVFTDETGKKEKTLLL